MDLRKPNMPAPTIVYFCGPPLCGQSSVAVISAAARVGATMTLRRESFRSPRLVFFMIMMIL
jgi:hypothetical protein